MTVESSNPTLPSGMFPAADVDQMVLDRYRLDAPLGAGGMGTVWRARDTVLGRDVALKIMTLGDPLARARFLREGKLAARLDHPGLCRIYDVGQDEHRGFLVMELLSGTTLFRLAENGLALPRALTLIGDVADAMAHAHAAGLIHRDLKPENVLLDRKGDDERVVVIDFGLAFSVDGAEATGRLTQADVTGGTPVYMSPEQARAAALSAASDVYALGCILFELVADRPPFDGAPALVMSKHVYTAPPVLSTLVPGLPESVSVLTARMLQKAPADRPTMIEIARECTRIAQQLEGGGWRPGFGRGKVVEERAHRMVTQTEAAQALPTEVAVGSVAVVGPVPDEVMVALAASGVACHRRTVAEAATDDLIVCDGDDATVTACLSTGRPVVAAVDAGDIAGSLALARRGVADVVTRPLAADVAARKIERRLRRVKPGKT